MSIKKKKRRKSRAPIKPVVVEETVEDGKEEYRDEFQTNVGGRIEKLGDSLKGKGKSIIYSLLGFSVILLLIGGFFLWKRNQNLRAQTALGSAIETQQAFVTDAPVPEIESQQTFKTTKARAEAAIKKFQAVADNYGSPYSERAKYFIAVNKLITDKPNGMKELQQIASGSDENAMLAKFALGQEYESDGKLDEALKLYQELIAAEDPVISKDTLNFAVAGIYKEQGKEKEAADLYFNIANGASERKDSEGNQLPFTRIDNAALAELKKLDPERAKKIKVPEEPKVG